MCTVCLHLNNLTFAESVVALDEIKDDLIETITGREHAKALMARICNTELERMKDSDYESSDYANGKDAVKLLSSMVFSIKNYEEELDKVQDSILNECSDSRLSSNVDIYVDGEKIGSVCISK